MNSSALAMNSSEMGNMAVDLLLECDRGFLPDDHHSAAGSAPGASSDLPSLRGTRVSADRGTAWANWADSPR